MYWAGSQNYKWKDRANPPDNTQHQNHEKNRQQEHAWEQHVPQECPAMGDQGRFWVDPAKMLIELLEAE